MNAYEYYCCYWCLPSAEFRRIWNEILLGSGLYLVHNRWNEQIRYHHCICFAALFCLSTKQVPCLQQFTTRSDNRSDQTFCLSSMNNDRRSSLLSARLDRNNSCSPTGWLALFWINPIVYIPWLWSCALEVIILLISDMVWYGAGNFNCLLIDVIQIPASLP